MESENEWITIMKKKQLCNIRSCYSCNKNFFSNKSRQIKKRKFFKIGKWDKVLNEKRNKTQADKFCKLECKFCLEIIFKIQHFKENQEKEIGEKEAVSQERNESLNKDLEESKEFGLDHEKYFSNSKNRKTFSILDRVRIVGINK
jgi:hypothetical protein